MVNRGPVLGIDPGSVATGFGIVWQKGSNNLKVVHAGVIRTSSNLAFPAKLKYLYDEISNIIHEFKPVAFAIEDVFVAKNVKSALKLGHARASLIMAALNSGLPVYEYSPLEIKKAVVGYGRAEKKQVQHMVSLILNLKKTYPKDASDALAVALCHIQSMQLTKFISINVAR